MKFLLNQFAIDHLKFQAEEWDSVKINQIFQLEFDEPDVIYVEFSTIDDVIKVNTKFHNLSPEASERILQFIPQEAKMRYKSFESAAYELRKKDPRSIKTKIRAGVYDFKLLTKYKTDKTPWSHLNPIYPPWNTLAQFEVGVLKPQDCEKEEKEEEEIQRNIAKKKKKKENIDILTEEEFVKGLIMEHIPDDVDPTETQNKEANKSKEECNKTTEIEKEDDLEEGNKSEDNLKQTSSRKEEKSPKRTKTSDSQELDIEDNQLAEESVWKYTFWPADTTPSEEWNDKQL